MGVAVPSVGGGRVIKRLASTLVLLPLFVLLLTRAPDYLFDALVVAASAIALWELTRLLEGAGRPVHRRLAIVAGAMTTAAFGVAGGRPFAAPAFVLSVTVLAILTATLGRGAAPSAEPAANSLLAVMYIGWLLGYGILLHHTSPMGDELVLFLVGVTWVGETAAYLVGSSMGRHRLAPVISPKKTVEGALAQVVTSVLTAAALGAWLLPSCSLTATLAAGALLGVVGQVGDLAESAIKRSVGTKDTGTLIPGHGGILDRIDSLLFNLPAFYYVSVLTGCR
jgi:phosphatidate cytidylyltransferase